MRQHDVDNINDFIKYYTGAWVGIHDPKDKDGTVKPYFVDKSAAESIVKGRLLSKDNNGIFALTNTNYAWEDFLRIVEMGCPWKSVVTYGLGAQYRYGGSPRSSHRGFRARGNRFIYASYEWERLNLPYVSEQQEVWEEFNRKVWTTEEAERDLRAGVRLACPISTYMCAVIRANYVHPEVYFKMDPVGQLINGVVEVDKDKRQYVPIIKAYLGNYRVRYY